MIQVTHTISLGRMTGREAVDFLKSKMVVDMLRSMVNVDNVVEGDPNDYDQEGKRKEAGGEK